MTLSPADLSLFIGQEVQTPDGVSWLYSVSKNVCEVIFLSNGKATKQYPINEIKPICRRINDMTEEERQDFYNNYPIGLLSMESQLTYKEVKYLTSKGICPFQVWIDEGLVIIEEPNKKRHFGFDPVKD